MATIEVANVASRVAGATTRPRTTPGRVPSTGHVTSGGRSTLRCTGSSHCFTRLACPEGGGTRVLILPGWHTAPVDIALPVVVVLAVVVVTSALASRLAASAPLLLVAVGVVASYLPVIPEVELTPDLVLIGLLPPLLYSAAIRTSLIDFSANRRPILLLSVGLVIFTAVGVGLTIWWLLPVPFAVALALGAVVAPPDAVAATAIARRVGLPRRMVTILEGESLVNDATAIVLLRSAIAATLGAVTIAEVSADLAVSVLGGLGVGLVVFVVVAALRRRIADPVTDVAVSLLTPWVAYIPAEEIHASGVLAVVVAGLLLGHKSPVIQSATSRLFEQTNWATISFLLENAVFLLIGMQIRSILEGVGASTLSGPIIVGACLATLVAVVGLRFVWVFLTVYLPARLPAVRARREPVGWRTLVVVSWAGMRGVVTLAAVFLLPAGTEHREVIVLVAFVVTIGTLLLQGLTLPWLVRRLGISGPDPAEDHLQQASVYQRASQAGLEALDAHLTGDESAEVVQRLRTRSADRTNALWERLGPESETPSTVYARLRARMLDAERAEVLAVRGLGTVDHEVLRQVMYALDVEETMLEGAIAASTAERDEELVSVAHPELCDHLREPIPLPTPRTPQGCEECLRDGTQWVHLRLCLACGHVGCCDSGPWKHATRHHEETAHPVMRSFETGEGWRWCYADQQIG